MRTVLRCGIAVLVSLLFFAAPAAAATVYASPNGGSTSDGTCMIVTCELQHAIAVSHDGDTIQLSSGTYDAGSRGRLTVYKAITIAGDPSGPRPVFTSPNDPPVLFTAGNATLRYVTVQADVGYALGFNYSVDGLKLDRVLAQAPQGSIFNSTATIANSVLKSTSGGPYGAVAVAVQRVDDSGDPGVVSLVNSTLTGPTALMLQSFCYYAGGNNYFNSHVRMRNTLLRATNDVAFPDQVDNNCDEPNWGARLDVDYSNYRPGTIANASGPLTTLTQGSHNQTDGGDTNVIEEDGGFRETASSPMIDSGNDADVVGTLDYFGKPRISGSAVDIGATEYTPIPGPAAFDLTAPADGAEYWNNSLPTLEWETSPDADHYVLYVDGNVKQQNLTGTSTTLADDLPDGTHTWKVVAVNTAGGETDSTSTRTFKLDLDGPSSFILSSPVSGETLGASPTFDWSASSGADHYDLYVDGAVNRSGLTTRSATPASPLNGGSHTWKVVAVDTHGRTMDSTQTNTFTVDSTPPGAFALASPGQDGYVATTTPLFQWNEASGAEYYTLIIDGINDHRVFGTSDHPLHALTEGTHTWKLIAVDSAGNSTESATRTFTIDVTPPGAFGLAAPAGDALTAASPTLSWAAAAGADHYTVVIDGLTNRTGVSSTSATPATPLTDGAHTWKVVAVDAAGNTTNSSSTRNITVDATPPAPFSLGAPADGDRVTTASPELSWSAAAGAESYTLVIDGATAATDLHDTRATPSAPLADGTHAWKVIARDGVGNTTASPTRAFTVDTSPTGTPPAETPTPEPGGTQAQPNPQPGPQQPQPGPQPQPAAPAATFSLVSKRAARSGAVTYQVKVSGAGALSATAKPVGKKWTAASGKARAKGAGTVALVLKPTSRAKRGRRNLKVLVVVTFTPADGGSAATRNVKLTLRLPRR